MTEANGGMNMLSRNKLYIAGQWLSPGDAGCIEVHNPATEEVLGTIPAATARTVDQAVAAGRGAFAG